MLNRVLLFCSLVLSGMLPCPGLALTSKRTKYNLPIVNKVIGPDGYHRSSVLAGGTFPGPVIQGTKGNHFHINVINFLDDDTMARSTSVHWHGIFQKSTNWADGSSFVSQCPIAPNKSFLYEFSVMEQAGTFWYHSHLSTQYCDGLRGPFIVYDPQDPHRHLYDVDDESTIITLADWYHRPSPSAHGQIPPPPNSTLINGKGRFPNGPAVPLAVIRVDRFKRYRLRIIAMSCDPNFTFSVDEHSLLIIEADGENTTPLLADSLQILAGQRYSVVLFANKPIGNYWIRSHPNQDRGSQGFSNGINSAILRYAGAPASDPQTAFLPSTQPLNEVDLCPLWAKSAPGYPSANGADVAFTIRHKFDFDTFTFKMNGATWFPPTVPVLLQILSGTHSAQDLLPKGSIYPLPRNKVIELTLPGTDGNQGGPHPFHLHGHSFSVVRSAGSSVYDYHSPVRRDTVSTGGSSDNVTIRFETDNSGPWFLHCHIDWHLDLGLAVVFAEDIPGPFEFPSKQWEELCPTYDSLVPSQQGFENDDRNKIPAYHLSLMITSSMFPNNWTLAIYGLASESKKRWQKLINYVYSGHSPSHLHFFSLGDNQGACTWHLQAMLDSIKTLILGVLWTVGEGQRGYGASTMVISNNAISPDGFTRSTVLAGGTFPGPVVKGYKGDRFQINVVNLLKDDTMLKTTSVHWHGIFQRNSSWADGMSFITQCPITPGNSFLYDFHVPDQAGTFWYHSHDSTQYCDGLRGAFIVYDPYDPHRFLYDIDDESTIITLSDWYHNTALSAKGQAPPIANSTLINGKGRFPGGPSVSLAVLEVQQFKRYRLRIISMSCDPNFTFSIDGHELLVIEADGENTEPLLVDSIQIFAGQRYSAILFANNTVQNYWIRSEPNIPRAPSGFEGGINSAILRYVGAPAVDPSTYQNPMTHPLREIDLHPLYDPRAPGGPWLGGADLELSIFHEYDFSVQQYKLNGVSWESPTVPVLLQILSGAKAPQDLLPKGSIYALPSNKVIEISLPGTGEGIHPFHLHGHAFSVVRSAGSNDYNFLSPVRRDTVNTGIGNDNVTIRFVTDNAGPWFLHCHIDWHLDLGLAIVFAEDIATIARDGPPPESWEQLCPSYNAFMSDSTV